MNTSDLTGHLGVFGFPQKHLLSKTSQKKKGSPRSGVAHDRLTPIQVPVSDLRKGTITLFFS